MAANKIIRLGPLTVSSSVANLFNPPTLTGGVNPPGGSTNAYYVIQHIRIINKTASSVAFSGYIGASGASAAGTEFIGTNLAIAANSAIDWYGRVRLDAADFLTGGAGGSANALVITGEGEMGVA